MGCMIVSVIRSTNGRGTRSTLVSAVRQLGSTVGRVTAREMESLLDNDFIWVHPCPEKSSALTAFPVPYVFLDADSARLLSCHGVLSLMRPADAEAARKT